MPTIVFGHSVGIMVRIFAVLSPVGYIQILPCYQAMPLNAQVPRFRELAQLVLASMAHPDRPAVVSLPSCFLLYFCNRIAELSLSHSERIDSTSSAVASTVAGPSRNAPPPVLSTKTQAGIVTTTCIDGEGHISTLVVSKTSELPAQSSQAITSLDAEWSLLDPPSTTSAVSSTSVSASPPQLPQPSSSLDTEWSILFPPAATSGKPTLSGTVTSSLDTEWSLLFPSTTVPVASRIPFSLVSTFTNEQGGSAPLQAFTLILTDSQGIPTSTVTQVSQPAQPPPVRSQPVLNTQPSADPLQTVTLVLTDARGNPTSTVTQLSRPFFTTLALLTQASPNPTFIPSFPSVTPAPGNTSITPSCQPYPECLVSASTSTDGGAVCSPLPGCIFPTVTGKPTSCSPFPSCLSTVIPSSVQNELGSVCDGTPLVDCIFTKPNPVCISFPECLSDGVDPDICPGYPFPDCLFTLYDPKVTSVMTTLPPGVTIRTSSNDNYSTNTWSSSTDSDGHLFFFPIIVGCPGCTSLLTIIDNIDGFFNTIFKFPPIPFPKFPKIPKLHFPCIFFCKKGHRHNKPKPPVYDEPNKPNEENETQTSSATSSSQSSCEAATASACTVISTVKVDGTMSITMTSTSCSLETKCSATGHSSTTVTTTSATAKPTMYYITPNHELGMPEINSFTEKLKAETDPRTLFISGGDIWTGFWAQNLNYSQVDVYKKELAVASIFTLADRDKTRVEPEEAFYPDYTHIRGPNLANETREHFELFRSRQTASQQQKTNEDSLKTVSQPKGVRLDLIGTYAYQTEEPGVRIYVVDSGFDSTHPFYDSLVSSIGEPEWIWPGQADGATHELPYEFVESRTDSDEFRNHGTAMISRVVGQELGVSKKAALTIVRLPQGIPNEQEKKDDELTGSSFTHQVYRMSILEDAINRIIQDVVKKGLQQKAVVNMSLSFSSGDKVLPARGAFNYGFYSALKMLSSLGVTVVVSAGNGGGTKDGSGNIDNSWIMDSDLVKWSTDFPIIVVGGVDSLGFQWRGSKYQAAEGFPESEVGLWAPAVGLTMATGLDPETDTIKDSGTSQSAAMVSGLVAYLLGVKTHRDKITSLSGIVETINSGHSWSSAVLSYAQRMSYPRQSTGGAPAVIYNDEIPLNKNGGPVCKGSGSRKRQTGDECIHSDPDAEASSRLASIFSVSSASMASVSSASMASKTATAEAPKVTGTFSGYIGSNCIRGNVTPMIQEDSAKVAAQLCSRSYTWDTKNKPPRDTKDTSGATVEFNWIANGLKTLGQINPTESVATACSSGTYPRSLTAGECQKAYMRSFSECPTGGQLSWVTEDHHGCMNFFMNQSPTNTSPEITNPPPPPPPESSSPPPPPPPTTSNHEKCFKSDEFEDELAILPGLASTAITSFCSRFYTWQHFNQPADGEPGPDAHVIRKTPSGLAVIELRAVTAPFVEGSSDEACRVNKYPRSLSPEICAYAFNHLKDSVCTYGGQNIATSVAGCYAFTMKQTQNFDG
ncbi:hypothetical protein BKA65DRAFT_596922 [Rhexocercosporidium sp. MPI-PUGE-AT-0058]|nr:hypothetical protein BKA65DRAFT_596922 [Rhexocercosporidium sp. MPI-PUGE-AT-0058]